MRVAIIGVGLLGGSLAYRLRDEGLASYIVGIDTNAAHLTKALSLGMIDAVGSDKDLHSIDLFILAIPVDTLLLYLPKLLDSLSDTHVVMDVSSAKHVLAKHIDTHVRRRCFVSTHPMWGTEYSGPEAAQRKAFEGRVVVICDKEKSDAGKLSIVENLYQRIGMRLVYMNSVEHDVHTAYISHVSHITSFALANTVLEKEKDKATIFDLAGSGFESTVRLAKSSAAMWVPVFEQNKENILVVLKEHIRQLQTFQEALQKNQSKRINKWIREANQIKKILP